jgi:alkylated DNA nucleotide flippase Atl1
MRTRKSWRQKLADDKGLPRVERITPRMSSRWGKGTVLIPAPREVAALMQSVPEGKLTTINEIRAALAAKHRATIGCPIATGIFAWIASHAAEEAAAAGELAITPYWRTLKTGGQLNPKYPGGIPVIRRRLAAEGHTITKRGQRYFVADYERALISVFP